MCEELGDMAAADPAKQIQQLIDENRKLRKQLREQRAAAAGKRLEFSKKIFIGVSVLALAITGFSCWIIWRTMDTSALAYLIPAVFNDLTLGLAMVANHKVTLTFWGTMGLAVGSCLGFMLMGWIILEGRFRINAHAVPRAFRGAPVILIYLGIAALAMLGFGSSILL